MVHYICMIIQLSSHRFAFYCPSPYVHNRPVFTVSHWRSDAIATDIRASTPTRMHTLAVKTSKCTHTLTRAIDLFLSVQSSSAMHSSIGQNIKSLDVPSVRSQMSGVRRLWTRLRRDLWTDLHQIWNMTSTYCATDPCCHGNENLVILTQN